MDPLSCRVGDAVTLLPLTSGRPDWGGGKLWGSGEGGSPLWGSGGRVVSVAAWGAYVEYQAAGRAGIIRLGWGEMRATPEARLRPVSANGSHVAGGAKSPGEGGRIAPRAAAVVTGPTGDCCGRCGSTNLTRAGTCLLCQDCGDTSGGCG